MNSALMFSKASDEWETPQAFFDALDAEFGFDLDVAATPENAKCADFLQADHLWSDGEWNGRICWMNPPYSNVYAFIKKAAAEAQLGATVVCLVPSRTDTRWWHAYVWDAEKHQPREGVEIRFVKGRLKFGGATAGAPFPSVVIVFRGRSV
jgi:phage N-6-adenine-methyltransferase